MHLGNIGKTVILRAVQALVLMTLLFQGTMAYRERFWHEEFFKEGPTDPDLVEELNAKILYPNHKACVSPQQESALNSRSKTGKPKADGFEGRWSDFFSQYFFDYGYEIHNWEAETGSEDADSSLQPWTETASLFLILIVLILFLIACTVVIPILGWLGFTVFRIFWWIISHAFIVSVFRRIWIYNEMRKRRRARWLHLLDNTKTSKHQSRLPNWMRDYKEEEIPIEIQEMDDEVESEGALSSDDYEEYLRTHVVNTNSTTSHSGTSSHHSHSKTQGKKGKHPY